MANKVHTISPLNKTWIFDIDGTIAKHNGYKLDGEDTMLEGALEFFHSIPKEDFILFLTSRTEEQRQMTEEFLKKNNIRYNAIVFNAPYGERILINDRKPTGLDMAYAINTNRDEFMKDSFLVDPAL